jgi:hypothetical protein
MMDEALCLCTVYKWHERFMQGRTELFDNPRSKRPLQNDLADALRVMIQEFLLLFANVFVLTSDSQRVFACASYTMFSVWKSSIYDRSRTLSTTPKRPNACHFPRTFWEFSKKNQKKGFAQIITGDESWLYFDYLHQSVLVSSRDDVPERIKSKIDTEKCLILVIWSVNGIHSLLDVPKGTTYNSIFFCDVVVSDLLENVCTHSRRQTLKRVWVHVDNACLHNSKKSNECLAKFHARRVPHPIYSPYFAPSDFFIFGTVKTEMQTIISTRSKIWSWQ